LNSVKCGLVERLWLFENFKYELNVKYTWEDFTVLTHEIVLVDGFKI